MAQNIVAATTRQTRSDDRRAEWWRKGAIAGFFATIGMTFVLVASFLLANAIGNPAGSIVQRWVAALGDNPVTRSAADAVALAVGVNLLVGWGLALVYARWAEPALSGPGWRKGMLFSLIPFLLSLVVFLPAYGGGFFGAALGAGPLPVLGNLILHLVYGGILGGVYSMLLGDGLDESDDDWGVSNAVVAASGAGVAAGLLVGALVGWLAGPLITGGNAGAGPILAVAMVGGAFGLTIGALVGLDRTSRKA